MTDRIRPRRKLGLKTPTKPEAPPAVNPALRDAVLKLLDEQLAKNEPRELRTTLERLVGLGYTRESARELLAHVVVSEIFEVMARGERYDRVRYLAALERLPRMPGEPDAADEG
jgi:hypothetical protein